ncbi:MAG TPA: TolC family protein [Bacteroidales bacterium]|nr:TolC family protein [Bacteroidales bacterium]
MRKLILIFTLSVAITGASQGIPLIGQQDSIWTLEKCINYALNRNIQVRKSELSNKQYQVYEEQARAQRFPSANASISQNFNWSKSTATGVSGLNGNNGSNVSVNSGVTIFNASKLTNLIKQADLSIESGKYSLETTKESISLSILDAYLQILYAEEQVQNAEKQIVSTKSQLDLAEERFVLKAISQSDYAQVKSQLAGEKLTLANSQSQLLIAKVTLEQLMELPLTEDFKIAHPDLAESLNQNRIPDVKSVYETALAIKPQIKNAAINKEISSYDEEIARAELFPTLSASAGISSGYTSLNNGSYFGQINNSVYPSVGFSLSIPIYQKKQAKTSIAVAKIGYENADLSEIDTKNALRKSIEQACVDVTSAQIKYEASKENYSATLEASNLSDEKFKQGVINSVDYLVSKTNMIVAESELLQSKYNLIVSYKIMDYYVGIPLSL